MHLLIAKIFNQTFSSRYNTRLAGGYPEPFYQAPRGTEAAVICYREDYSSSALHEVAHWCIAGEERRRQDDFGYWYQPDGRDEKHQREFESAEVKPQALEWLFSIAAGVEFRISADNLATNNLASTEFAQEVYRQAQQYLSRRLPERAGTFVDALVSSTDGSIPTPDSLRDRDLEFKNTEYRDTVA